MSNPITRRAFHAAVGTGVLLGTPGAAMSAENTQDPPAGPTEAPFERDYPAPRFKPSWKRPQINKLLVQDFVIFAHSDPTMVKKLLEREPALLNASMDWGAGDWESGLGAAAHMGRRDIAEFLIEKGARADIFAAAMLGQLDIVKAWLTLQPKLIDSKGPHGFGLHFHAQAGGKQSAAVLEYLQSVKKVELMAPKAVSPPKK
jgi:hypothetical protein